MNNLKKKLASDFKIKDLGQLKYFLGMDVAISKEGIMMSQRKYVLDLLKETRMSGCHPGETLIDSTIKFVNKGGNSVDHNQYQRLVRKLIYLSHTRPDIAFVVSLVSQFMHSPKEEHQEAGLRILKYLKISPGKRLFSEKVNMKALKALQMQIGQVLLLIGDLHLDIAHLSGEIL